MTIINLVLLLQKNPDEPATIRHLRMVVVGQGFFTQKFKIIIQYINSFCYRMDNAHEQHIIISAAAKYGFYEFIKWFT